MEKSSRDTEVTSVYLRGEQRRELDRIADEEERSISFLVREAVDLLLENRKAVAA